MARVKGAMMTRKRRNKTLKLAKGYWGAKSKHFKMAKQAVMKSGNYAFAGRKMKKKRFPFSLDYQNFRAGKGQRHQLFKIYVRAEEGRHHAQSQDACGACGKR